MNLILLTSSRADYGIYLPLLNKIVKDDFFKLKIVAFGTHLSELHGSTYKVIENDGFGVYAKIENLVHGDSPESIATSIGLTTIKFASFWQHECKKTDIIICLGDRFEMFAAVVASLPFGIPVCHISGGETTLGAIDDPLRHSITHIAKYHFVTTAQSAERVEKMTNSDTNIFNTGSLGLDNLSEMKLYTATEMKSKYNIDFSMPTILFTFHPETTVEVSKNSEYINAIIEVLKDVPYQIVITMPNADTAGNVIRHALNNIKETNFPVIIVENFGTLGYFSALKHCSFMLGNSSSGITEAASLNKYVINLGNRQKGRIQNPNVINCEIEPQKIHEAIKLVASLPNYASGNVYWKENVADNMISILKNLEKH